MQWEVTLFATMSWEWRQCKADGTLSKAKERRGRERSGQTCLLGGDASSLLELGVLEDRAQVLANAKEDVLDGIHRVAWRVDKDRMDVK